MRYGGWLRLGLSVATVITGCHRAPTEDAIAAAVDRRLAELGIHGAPGTSPSVAAPVGSAKSAETGGQDAAAASIAFLAQLDDLMKDYKPELPVVEDKSDVLRCVTSDSASSNADIRSSIGSLKSSQDAMKRERGRRNEEFYNVLYPLAFHVDYDWQTRGAKAPAVFACWDCMARVSPPNCEMGAWATSDFMNKSAANCTASRQTAYRAGRVEFGVGGEWRQRAPEGKFIFRYTGTDVAPTQPPEIMRRLVSSGVPAPQRVSCRVEDVIAKANYREVKCRSTGPALSLHVTGNLASVNIGDVVSTPLADVHAEPDGVLFKNLDGKSSGWVVVASGATLNVDAPAACPTINEILAAGGVTPTPSASASGSTPGLPPTTPATPVERKDCQACSFNDACTVVRTGTGPCCMPIRNGHDCPDPPADSPIYRR